MDVTGESDVFAAPALEMVERALEWEEVERRPFWLGYALLAELGHLNGAVKVRAQSRAWADEWLLIEMIERVWHELELSCDGWGDELRLALTAASAKPEIAPLPFLNALLADDAARAFLKINNFEQTLWFNGEGAARLGELLRETQEFEGANWPLATLEEAREKAGFRVVRWMEEVRKVKGTNGTGAKTPLDFAVSTSI